MSSLQALRRTTSRKGEGQASPARFALPPRSLRGYSARGLLIAFGILLCCFSPGVANAQTFGCSPAMANDIVCENSKAGSPSSVWDISGAGDSTIQGFATDMSVSQGGTVFFKINTNAAAYTITIFRMGYYSGNGARQIATVSPSVTLPQTQPACKTDSTTFLYDCGNWAISASWQVPANATSGIYFAVLKRTDTGGASHIFFIVRNDASHSDILFQTSDETWQAYNAYGGHSVYGQLDTFDLPNRAYKVSYNRPFITRGFGTETATWVFGNEYPMVRWVEANGYDVTYFTGIDAARSGTLIQNHKVYMDCGHDEYVSGPQRTNIEAARDAGVNLAFFSGNEFFWKIRWENSIDGTNTAYRTMVVYKETLAFAQIDPDDPPTWTGTWRDPSFSPPADGGRPENALTGTIFMVNGVGSDNPGNLSIQVPAADGKMRFWRKTTIANLASGTKATLPAGTLGYEWDEDLDNGARPAGTFDLSTATYNLTVNFLLDYGATYGAGTATHRMTMHRATSGALVFGAGTVQFSWGLDSNHDNTFGFPTPAPSTDMQQATVNLFADMGVQPASLQGGLLLATKSTDTIPPFSTITSPASGTQVRVGTAVNITGTAADAGGGVVGGVEISLDGGNTWHPAAGRESWTYGWTPTVPGNYTLRTRATDDSGNLEIPSAGTTVAASASAQTLTSLTLGSNSVTSGNTVQGTVMLGQPAASGGVVVTLSSTNPSVASVPSTVTVPAGQFNANFTVTSFGVLLPTSVTISGTYVATSSATLTVKAPLPPPPGSIAIDVTTSKDQAAASATVTSPAFSTAVPNELLLALISSDALSAGVNVAGVNGAGLTWSLVQRTNAQMGTAEIWRAFAPAALSNVTVTATLSQSVDSSMTIMSFAGVDTTSSGAGAIGATAPASASSGAPNGSLTTTRANSLVLGVGTDWDQAVARTTPTGQTLIHQYLSPPGDTYWVQQLGATTPVSGTVVTINDVAPTTDRYDLALVEVRPPVISNLSISGTISPAAGGAGSTVSLTGTASATVTADSSGNFNFGSLQAGSYTVTPSKTGFLFTPANQAVTLTSSNVSNLTFTATAVFSVAGSITPSASGSGSLMTLAQGSSTIATVPADASGNYVFNNVPTGSYTVTPTKSGFNFNPSSQAVTVTGANVSGINFTASAPTFTVSGSITPASAGGGATVNLSQGSTTVATATADANTGGFTFTGIVNGTYTVTPIKSGFGFTPASRSVTVNGSNVTSVTFTAAQGFTISGNIGPVGSGSGSSVTLTQGSTTVATSVADASGNYSFSGVVNGTYSVIPSRTGFTFAPVSQTITVNGAPVSGVNFTAQAIATAIAIDATAPKDNNSASTTITTPAFSTAAGNELVLAFISTDALSAGITATGVSGGGLTWTLVQRTNVQMGTAEIWSAFAPSPLTNVTVTANLSQSVTASMTVMSFSGVDATNNGAGAIGAKSSANATSGAPSASLITTRNNSLVLGVGNDWDAATARTLGANQSLVHQLLSTNGDTYWVQRQTATTPLSGTTVAISDTAPTGDRWNLSLLEILPSTSGGTNFTLSGNISPAPAAAGTLVTLSGNNTGTTGVDSNGNYSFTLANGTYTVTPSKSGFFFTPSQQTLTISGASQSNINFTVAPVTTNPILSENLNQGSAGWQPTNLALAGEIEGYASATSINKGGSVTVYVNSNGASFTLDLYRLGWYQGLGGRLMMSAGTLAGQSQPSCPQDTTYGLIQCSWNPTLTITTSTTWTTGLYLAHIRRSDTGKDNYITFIVRDDSSNADILFDSNVNTMQAYNGWGGKSLYAGLSSPPQPSKSISNAAVKVSFDRPYQAFDFSGTNPNGEDDQVLRWEYQMIRWMESQGFNVSYSTNVDTSNNAAAIVQHKAYVTAGHNEYWTSSMRNNLEAAANAGTNIAVFTSNSSYWQVRYETSSSGTANRVIVGFKESASTFDPLFNDPANSTTNFRASPINRPENVFLGAMYGDFTNTDNGFPFVVSQSSYPFYRNTGLANGNSMAGLVGDEWDNTAGLPTSNMPANVQGLVVLSNSPTSSSNANAVIHQLPGGALIFDASTLQWSWGLDNTMAPINAVNAKVAQITTNILNDMGATPLAPSSNVLLTSTYSVAGHISGITSVATVTLSGTDSRVTSTDSNGNYIFKVLMNGSYTVTPSQTGATFMPAGQSVTINGASVPNVNFSTAAPSFTVSGSITPASIGSGSTVTLAQGGSTISTATADVSGNYSFSNVVNGSYTVTPTKSGTAFSPTSQAATVNGAPVSGVNFTAATQTWIVSGSITPAANGTGAVVALTQGSTTIATATADGTGAFTFTGIINGTYTITPSKNGFSFSPASQGATVNGANVTGVNFTAQTAGTGLAIDITTFKDNNSASSTITTAAFSTTASNELLLAFIASDALSASVTVSSVSGGSLTWTLVQRTNAQLGTSEIWRAFATSPLTNITVTANLSQTVTGSMTVMSFIGADPAGPVGATVTASASSGAPSASLITTRNNSMVLGVGNDWDTATSRTLGANQTLVHQLLSANGDTYWVQRQTATTVLSGTSVSINDTAPTGDRYNLSICEILPAP